MHFHELQKKRMDFAEVTIDNKFHKHIIGKSGQNSKKSFIYFFHPVLKINAHFAFLHVFNLFIFWK